MITKYIQKIKLKRLKNKGLKFGEGLELGKAVDFGSEPYLINIGNNVRISSHSSLVTHDGGLWTLRKMNLLENADFFGIIEIGDNVNIGINVIIMPGVKIGNNCIIGAGAVVTKNIPDNSIAVGVPARVIETVDEYYNKKKDKCDFTKNMSYKEKKQYLYKKYKE